MYKCTHIHTNAQICAFILMFFLPRRADRPSIPCQHRQVQIEIKLYKMVKIHKASNLFVHVIVFQCSINIPLCCFRCFCTISRQKPLLCDVHENGGWGEVGEEMRGKGIRSVDERLGADENEGWTSAFLMAVSFWISFVFIPCFVG